MSNLSRANFLARNIGIRTNQKRNKLDMLLILCYTISRGKALFSKIKNTNKQTKNPRQ